MPKQAKKSPKNLGKLVSVREGRQSYLTEIADNAKIVLVDESLHSQLKFKHFKIRKNEELEYIKGLANEIIDLLDEDLELLSDIKRTGEFRAKLSADFLIFCSMFPA